MNGIPDALMSGAVQNVSPFILTEKKCPKCKTTKPSAEFHLDRGRPGGLQSRCRQCISTIQKGFRKTHPGHRREYENVYRASHREEYCRYSKNWYAKNVEQARAADREYGKRTRSSDPERGRATCKRWRINNPEAANKKDRKRHEKVMSTLHGMINNRISSRMCASLRGNKHGRPWETLVGYSLAQLMRHLEKHFLPGMSWQNRDLWHIDHKIPLSVFNFQHPEDMDFKKAWALKNLQPLWKHDNLVKNNRLDRPFQPSLAM
jgi:hypothetical protein